LPLPYFFRSRFDAFYHALQRPEAAVVFFPSLGFCLLLLIWGIAPGIELHRFRHRSPKKNCRRHSGLYLSPYLLLVSFLRLHIEDRHGKKNGEESMYGYFLHTLKLFARLHPCVQVRASVCVCA